MHSVNMIRAAVISVAILSVTLTNGRAEDTDCLPPHEGGPDMHGERECCATPELSFDKGSDMHEKMRSCMKESGMPEPPAPGSGRPPKPDEKTMDCVVQCACDTWGILSDGKIDKEAATAKLATAYTGVWAPVLQKAVDDCYAIAPSKVSESSTCKSGCRQFKDCVSRQLWLNCPASAWTDSDQCTQFKSIYTKCEDRSPMFILGGPHGPHGHHGHH